MRRKTKSLETLIFQGFSSAETRGIRTPDNLIKSYKLNSVFARFFGLGVPLGVFFATKKDRPEGRSPYEEKYYEGASRHIDVFAVLPADPAGRNAEPCS